MKKRNTKIHLKPPIINKYAKYVAVFLTSMIGLSVMYLVKVLNG